MALVKVCYEKNERDEKKQIVAEKCRVMPSYRAIAKIRLAQIDSHELVRSGLIEACCIQANCATSDRSNETG